MQVILLERIPRLGQMGEEVSVKPGFARNFLLPQGKALRANEANRARFESQRADLEARNLERQKEAETVREKLDGTAYVVVRQAGENGQLYGSVSTRDVAEVLDENGFKVARTQVELNQPIKVIGMHELAITLHPEVEATITLNVARNNEEAERQAKGESVTGEAELEAEEEELDIDLAEVFENPEDVDLAEIEGMEEEAPSDAPAEEAEEEDTDKTAS